MNAVTGKNDATAALRNPGLVWRYLARWWPSVRFNRAVKRLRVLETLQLGDKRQLMVVSIGERQLLIGAASNFLATLADLSSPAREPDPE